MRYIITGGTGLIGRALGADLARDGHDVVILSRDPGRSNAMPEGMRVVGWNARDEEGWGDLADGAHAIVNLAGENISDRRWTKEFKTRILESRLDAGTAVVKALKRAKKKPRVLIQASGIGYYGSRGDEELTEDKGPGDDFLAKVAVAWEDSTKSVESLEVRRVIIRSGIVLSAEGGALKRMLNVYKKFIGGPLGNGRQWFPWIHISDEVRAIKFLIDGKKMSGYFNLAAPHPLRSVDFSKALGRAVGASSFFSVPAFALRVMFGDMADALLASQRAIPKRLLESGFRFSFERVETALADLLK